MGITAKTVQVPCAECGETFALSARDYFAEVDYMRQMERQKRPVVMREWFCSMPCFSAYRDRVAGGPGTRSAAARAAYRTRKPSKEASA